jgi:hypothetical protein
MVVMAVLLERAFNKRRRMLVRITLVILIDI